MSTPYTALEGRHEEKAALKKIKMSAQHLVVGRNTESTDTGANGN